MKFEQTLFANLLKNEDYLRKVLPHLKEDYFKEYSEKKIFGVVDAYISKYNTVPTKTALLLELENVSGIKEREYDECVSVIETAFDGEVEPNLDWVVDKTETWCKDQAIYNAILKSVEIIDGSEEGMDKGMLPKLLEDALSVTFDQAIGHNFFENADERFDHYHADEDKIKFDISWLNDITNGGIPRKTLSCILAPPNSGKSLMMCSMAAAYMRMGYNVLYITMEMAEERIAERIDSNLLAMSNPDIKKLSRETFSKRMEAAKTRTPGGLVVKEYPTAGAHTGHFRHLINELRIKKKFKVDIVFVDYMNICLSQRVKGVNANSYTIVKSISEELRGLAVEQNLLIWTATQTSRNGIGNSDVDMTDISESIGVAATVDFMFAWIRTPEMDEQSSVLLKLIKNRFGSTVGNLRSLVGVNYPTMTVYDLDTGHAVDESGYVSPKSMGGTRPDSDKPNRDYGSINF